MLAKFIYNDTEIEELLKSLIILVDSREKENAHIINYFEKRGINYKIQKLDAGDYAAIIPKNLDLGIPKDLMLPVMIERKNSLDELIGSFKERVRFESEFIRATKNNFKILLLVEDGQGYQNILSGKYTSQYEPKALLGSLKAFESRYNFVTTFIDGIYSGNWIYYTLLYNAREVLKKGW